MFWIATNVKKILQVGRKMHNTLRLSNITSGTSALKKDARIFFDMQKCLSDSDKAEDENYFFKFPL